MKILAIDPGGSTGWSSITFPGFHDVVGGSPVWSFGEINWDNHHSHLRHFLDRQLGTELSGLNIHDLVICEGFDNRANPAAQLISLEYIGVVKGWVQERAFNAIFPSPSEKEWADDKKLKALKLYRPGKRHANDATRHLVSYLVNKKHYAPLMDQLRVGLHGTG